MSLATVTHRVHAHAQASGRDPQEIHIIAVSKDRSPEQIEPLLRQGHRLFGENRVQETERKWPALRYRYPKVELHLIGPLQTNKVTQALALFDVIQTLDRPHLARTLSRRQTPLPRLLIQVNTGREAQKSGVDPLEFPDFLTFCRAECALEIDGVMAIPPLEEDPCFHFALLSDLARRADLSQISMGMSADFETAIRFGATHLRIGRKIFQE